MKLVEKLQFYSTTWKLIFTTSPVLISELKALMGLISKVRKPLLRSKQVWIKTFWIDLSFFLLKISKTNFFVRKSKLLFQCLIFNRFCYSSLGKNFSEGLKKILNKPFPFKKNKKIQNQKMYVFNQIWSKIALLWLKHVRKFVWPCFFEKYEVFIM